MCMFLGLNLYLFHPSAIRPHSPTTAAAGALYCILWRALLLCSSPSIHPSIQLAAAPPPSPLDYSNPLPGTTARDFNIFNVLLVLFFLLHIHPSTSPHMYLCAGSSFVICGRVWTARDSPSWKPPSSSKRAQNMKPLCDARRPQRHQLGWWVVVDGGKKKKKET